MQITEKNQYFYLLLNVIFAYYRKLLQLITKYRKLPQKTEKNARKIVGKAFLLSDFF